jgi:hypothetical protein
MAWNPFKNNFFLWAGLACIVFYFLYMLLITPCGVIGTTVSCDGKQMLFLNIILIIGVVLCLAGIVIKFLRFIKEIKQKNLK